MLYRVTIDFAVTDLSTLKKLRDEVEALYPIVQPINPSQPHMEPAYIRVQRCYHDEDPPKGCTTIYYRQKPPRP